MLSTGASPLGPGARHLDKQPDDLNELRAALVGAHVFDDTWYVGRYGSLIRRNKDSDALTHFVRIGADLGLKPCPLFDTAWFLRRYPHVRRSSLNPLLYFLRCGKDECLAPHRLFDMAWYLATYRAAATSTLDPLSHFLAERHPLCRPHVLFDPAFYRHAYPDASQWGQNPLVHFLAEGAAEGRCPNAFFDTRWYLEHYPAARLSRLNPLSHYLEVGAALDYCPNPLFDSAWYRATYLVGAPPSTNPLCHFIEVGASLETRPNPLFEYAVYAGARSLETETLASLHGSYLSDDSNLCLPALIARQGTDTAHAGRRLLFVDAKYPRPDADSGSLDTYNHLKILRGLGVAVTFLATVEFFAAGDARSAVQELGVDCVDTYKFSSVEGFIESCGSRFDVFVLSRVYAGGHFFELARAVAPNATIIFNAVDLHHLRERRKAELEGCFARNQGTEWTRARELYLTRQSDITIVVSHAEADLLRREAGGGNIALVPLLRDIPGRATSFSEREHIGFVGGFGHLPNLDAVEFFLDSVWPRLLETMPELCFEIVGTDLPDRLLRRRDPNVILTGHVKHLDAVLARWRLTVAPLRYGAGAKGKIVSSLAHGVPCVATSIAIEGMDFEPGQIMIADDPFAFAAAVENLYRDEALWLDVSEAGLRAVSKRNDISHGTALWAGLLDRVRIIGSGPARPRDKAT